MHSTSSRTRRLRLVGGKQGRIVCVAWRAQTKFIRRRRDIDGRALISTHNPEGTHIPILQFYGVDMGELGTYYTSCPGMMYSMCMIEWAASLASL
jgi:hypothetical protein